MPEISVDFVLFALTLPEVALVRHYALRTTLGDVRARWHDGA